MAADVPLFNKNKHISYWMRCLRSPLPTAYTSNDAHRMTLAFFTVSALDLLGALFTRTTLEERNEYIDWIYGCQHPLGGFRGAPGFRQDRCNDIDSTIWDPANLAATFFGISALCVLGDDLKRLDRSKCLDFVKTLQRNDGGFAELKHGEHELVGGGDPRFAYMAASIRWIIRGPRSVSSEALPDVDVQALLGWLRSAETYGGGFASDGLHEAQAGLTFCALSALAFLNDQKFNLQHLSDVEGLRDASQASAGLPVEGQVDRAKTIAWLISLFTTEVDEDDYTSTRTSQNNSSDAAEKTESESCLLSEAQLPEKSFQKLRSTPAREKKAGKKGLDSDAFLIDRTNVIGWAGFAGRCNKVSDTCYVFWAGASLKLLKALDYVELEYIRCYLLEKTQHMMLGGFGKAPGDLPDIYHSYLGLAALSLINGHKSHGYHVGPDIENIPDQVDRPVSKAEAATRAGDSDRTLRALDPLLAFSTGAREWIESLEWHRPG